MICTRNEVFHFSNNLKKNVESHDFNLDHRVERYDECKFSTSFLISFIWRTRIKSRVHRTDFHTLSTEIETSRIPVDYKLRFNDTIESNNT